MLSTSLPGLLPVAHGSGWRTYVLLRASTVVLSVVAMGCWAYVLQATTPESIVANNGQRVGSSCYSQASVFVAGASSIVWAFMTAALLLGSSWRPSPQADICIDLIITLVALWATVYPMMWVATLDLWLHGPDGIDGLGAAAVIGMICTGALVVIHAVFLLWACRRFCADRHRRPSLLPGERPKSLAHHLGIEFDFEKESGRRDSIWTSDPSKF